MSKKKNYLGEFLFNKNTIRVTTFIYFVIQGYYMTLRFMEDNFVNMLFFGKVEISRETSPLLGVTAYAGQIIWNILTSFILAWATAIILFIGFRLIKIITMKILSIR